jgi:uncharacterized protein DUF3332
MREKWWKRLVVISCVVGLLMIPGCFGKSPVTTSVVKWHSELKWGKWSKEALYFPMFILVLPITAIVDAFIVNAINFWEKDDPLAWRDLGIPPGTDLARLKWESTETPAGPRKVALLAEPDGSGKAPRIVAAPGEMRVEDRDGRTVLIARTDPDGSVTVRDMVKGSSKTWSPEELAAAMRS